LKWANHCDLYRINGVGPQFAELLECAGVDTVKELKHRVAENLQKKLEEVNAQKNLTNRVPAVSEVQKMIDQAKELPAKMEY
jgi:predicted flap endonuclease-1-like 5' DNA nuclease